MAGGKETPRQKMIGMMYLVLTAMLALNVSKDILRAFVAIEENIQKANLVQVDRGNGFIGDVRSELTTSKGDENKAKREKLEAVLKQMDAIDKETATIIKFIDDLKLEILNVAGEQTKTTKDQDPLTIVWQKGDGIRPMRLNLDAVSAQDKYDEPMLVLGINEDLKNPKGKKVASKTISVSDKTSTITFENIKNPELWDTEKPNLYKLSAVLSEKNQIKDSVSEKVGFRWFEFKDHGPFYLNGKRLLIRGTHRHEEQAARRRGADATRDVGREAACLRARQPHHHSPGDNELVPAGFGVHAQHQVGQCGNAARAADAPGSGFVHAREHPQQGGLARAVAADESDAVALLE